jgi:hypothetical protein
MLNFSIAVLTGLYAGLFVWVMLRVRSAGIIEQEARAERWRELRELLTRRTV